MTNQEAIEVVKTEKECVLRNIQGCDRDCGKCDLVMEDKIIIEGYDMAIQALEKQIPKIPDLWGDGYSDGQFVCDMYTCPNCGENYEIDYDHYEYCPKCGQHMDKSGEVFE